MEDIVRGVLVGIAIGGFTATVIEANLITLKALWRFNRIAAETTCEMYHRLEYHWMKMVRQWRRRQQLESES